MTATLEEKLKSKSNDFSALELNFRRHMGHDLVRGGGHPTRHSMGCSIVIPFYGESSVLKYTLAALRSQNLPQRLKDKVEIILINDGARSSMGALLRQTSKIFPVRYLICRRNQGRAFARNAGLFYARREIIVFLDADMIVQPNFLAIHIERQERIKNSIIIGLREDVSLSDLKRNFNWSRGRARSKPDYRADFRYQRFVPEKWRMQFPWLPRNNFGRNYQLFTTTNYLKEFGFGRVVGIWELPSTVLTSNASVRRQNLIRVGGFDMAFRGWGMEDTHLAAKLIAAGAYVIPNIHLTAYHAVTRSNKSKKILRRREFERNQKTYLRLKTKPFRLWREQSWRKTMQKRMKNKLQLIDYPI